MDIKKQIELASKAYEIAGYDLTSLRSFKQPNPMEMSDWGNAGVEKECIYTYGFRSQSIGVQKFLDALDIEYRGNEHIMNYEPNYVQALIETNPRVYDRVKSNYLAELYEKLGTPEDLAGYFELNFGVNGPID